MPSSPRRWQNWPARFHHLVEVRPYIHLAELVPLTVITVYHWATVLAGPKYGRVVGFYAGWFNFLAWVFATSSTCAILGNALVQMYLIDHPEVVWQPWMVFIAFQLLNWLGCFIVCFGNGLLPILNYVGSFVVVGGVFVSIIVLAVMPKVHATNEFVWQTFVNGSGWSNSGLVFIMGLLNGGEHRCTLVLCEIEADWLQ
jgi:amino acid transporter